jgi:hypothetical protein
MRILYRMAFGQHIHTSSQWLAVSSDRLTHLHLLPNLSSPRLFVECCKSLVTFTRHAAEQSWTELNSCMINTTWCPPDQNLCVGLATWFLYRCSTRVLVNNAISGFASMELWVFLWNSLVSVKIWWDLISVKDCETQSNHRHACYATHSQYLYNIVQKCFPWIGL